MASHWRDALTRSIGTEEEVDVDVFGPIPLERDSAFLICSDGLYKTLSDDDLRDLFLRSGGPRGAAQAMVSAAFDGGSDDNISVAIAEYGELPRGSAPTTMVLPFEAGAEPDETPATLLDQPALAAKPAPDLATTAAAVEEGAVVAGFPVAALVAVGLVVAAVVAFLVFGA